MSGRFCAVCCSPHAAEAWCPGHVPATGPERAAWDVTVETPRGLEKIVVLMAKSHDLWRARISTHPRTLWLVPGGTATVKFFARSEDEALRQAIAFVDRHCTRRGYFRRDQTLPADTVREVPAPRAARPPQSPPLARKTCRLPLRYGVDRASQLAATANVSTHGMFVATRAPLDPGTALRIHLEMAGHTARLEGMVMWTRTRAESGRPLGMGVRLIHPPPAYADFVVALGAAW